MLKKFLRKKINIVFRSKGNSIVSKHFCSKNNTDSFMTGTSSVYIEQMYKQWKKDKTSVHSSWDHFFNNLDNGVSIENSFQSPPFLTGCNL
jgi:hypothetical protein